MFGNLLDAIQSFRTIIEQQFYILRKKRTSTLQLRLVTSNRTVLIFSCIFFTLLPQLPSYSFKIQIFQKNKI